MSVFNQAQKISAAQTIDLRSRILRPGQSIELCHYPEDNFSSTFHLGISSSGKIICNGTFIQQAHEKLNSAALPYRLRGMATEPIYQKQGLGSVIVYAGLQELEALGSDLLWFNARTSAESFYTKLGFDSFAEIFDIALIGPHKIMYKWLR